GWEEQGKVRSSRNSANRLNIFPKITSERARRILCRDRFQKLFTRSVSVGCTRWWRSVCHRKADYGLVPPSTLEVSDWGACLPVKYGYVAQQIPFDTCIS